MEYYSAIKENTFESVVLRWMNLEPVIQIEVSQKEKNNCCISIHIYMKSRKTIRGTILQRRIGDATVENTLVDTAWEREPREN